MIKTFTICLGFFFCTFFSASSKNNKAAQIGFSNKNYNHSQFTPYAFVAAEAQTFFANVDLVVLYVSENKVVKYFERKVILDDAPKISKFTSKSTPATLDHTNAFITTWDTDKLSSGYYVSFNTYGNQYEYYWEKVGDEANTNSGSYLIGANSSGQSLTIPQMATGTGVYKLYIKSGSGTFSGFQTYGHAGSAKALTAVESWGDIAWKNLLGAFLAAENLTSLPVSVPNLSQVTDLSFMFAGAKLFNQNISHWNVSNVTNMSVMFTGAMEFNQDISGWSVSNVSNMSRMFSGASAFNQNIGSWTLKSDVDLTNMLDNSGLDVINYGLTLKGWAENANTPANLTLGALGLRYKEEAQQYHDILTTQKNWIINDGGVLPVTILGFVAKLNGNQTNLRWQTSSEQNNKTFVVSRSADGKNFTELTRIAGAGNSSTLKSYTYNDHSPLNGANYYKLEQIDIDGEINFIGVEVVSFKLSTPSVTVYPNPTAGEINVVIPSEFGKTVTVNIVDMSGKTVYTEKLQLNLSQLSYKLNNQAIASGQYIVKIVGEAKTESLKLLIK